jgi:hypothetical protein
MLKATDYLAGCSDDNIGGAAGSTDSTVQGGLLVQELHGKVRSLKGAEALPAQKADQRMRFAVLYTDRQLEGQLSNLVSIPGNAQHLAPQPAYQGQLIITVAVRERYSASPPLKLVKCSHNAKGASLSWQGLDGAPATPGPRKHHKTCGSLHRAVHSQLTVPHQ